MPSEQIITSLRHKAKFFDYALDAMCILDENGIIQEANPSLKAAFAQSTATPVGRELQHFVAGEDRSEFQQAIAHVQDTNQSLSIECRMNGFDASEMWYLWTLYPYDDGNCLAIGRDVSPYILMESKERERNIFAEALLDTVLAINASLSLEQVLERILSNIGKVVAFDYVNILLVNGSYADLVGIHRRSPSFIDVTLNNVQRFLIDSNDHLERMTKAHDYVIIPHVERSLNWMTADDANYETGSFLGAPIIVSGDLIGFIGIFYKQADFFTSLHAQQLMTFANQVGITIKNARLYERSQAVAILQERQRVAQELHDSVNQDLFAASTYADLLVKAIHRKPEVATRYAKDVNELVRGAVEQMRMILIELQPDAITNTPLPTLIDRLTQTFTKRTGIPVMMRNNQAFTLDEPAQIAVYRIVQEVLHNIEKHAQASNIYIQMIYNDPVFEITITDDGIGFEQSQTGEFQFGLKNIRERASSIGASLGIDSPIGIGTTIKLTKVDTNGE